MTRLHKLIMATALLAFLVVVLGAYVRLSDAGLGCPDWPGCYGHLVVPDHTSAQQNYQQYAQKPLDAPKAWKEMAHRYLAGMLGLLILAIFISAVRLRRQTSAIPICLPLSILLLVIFQAMLGMWTVTLLLKPMVVSLHLMGGMLTFSLLAALAYLSCMPSLPPHNTPALQHLRPWAALGLLLLLLQILLGGWTSSNYAALACTDFPTCQGSFFPQMDFTHAFHVTRELGKTLSGAILPWDALTAIHWSHRVGALLNLLYLGFLIVKLAQAGLKNMSRWLLLLLCTQIALGVSNVLLGLPLYVAVGHNAVAALLSATMVLLNVHLYSHTR